VDKFGMRAVIATLAPTALLIVHSLLGFTSVDPVGPLVGQGLSYSGFAAVLWPSIPLVVEPKYIGLGYGFVTAVQNIGLACFPLIIATIYIQSGERYIPNVELFFMCLAAFGMLVGLYLNYYDINNNNIFNSPGKPIIAIDDGDDAAKLSASHDSIHNLRQHSNDDGHGDGATTGTGARSAGTFTHHEELFRARVASGDVAVVNSGGRSVSRASRDGRSADVLNLQGAYNPLLQPGTSSSSKGGSSRQKSSEILAGSMLQ
jgi:hypothetical protein